MLMEVRVKCNMAAQNCELCRAGLGVRLVPLWVHVQLYGGSSHPGIPVRNSTNP